MEFCPNFISIDDDPAAWAAAREAEGYPIVSVADHISDPQPHPHVWVTATTFALSTKKLRVMSAFSNNLFRSPVEFAHAALALQRDSGGRFEAGLGAGWAAREINGMGWEFPVPKDRAGRYIEAVQIARELLHTGKCNFKGSYYEIDIPLIGPLVEPPLLVASCAGPRVLKGVAPYVDKIELMGFSMTAAPDDPTSVMNALMSYTEDDLRQRIDLARDVAPETPLGFLALCGAGDDPALEAQSKGLGNSLFAKLVGPTEQVAETLHKLGDMGLDSVQIAPSTPDTLSNLAPLLNY
tara:strand:- start:402 stop:1286 length:885 start_codon:yes stop_codon:yes gene_type:complete